MFILNISKIFKLSNSNQEFICKRHSDNSSHVRQVNVQWWLSLFFPSPTYKYSKRRSTCMCQKQYEAKQRPRKKIYFASLITAVPRRRAGMPESWVPLTLVQSEQWYRWCTPTGPGSCCWHPSHLKQTNAHSINIMGHRGWFGKAALCGASVINDTKN